MVMLFANLYVTACLFKSIKTQKLKKKKKKIVVLTVRLRAWVNIHFWDVGSSRSISWDDKFVYLYKYLYKYL